MPLKLIGAGFGRTGTLSTKEALNRLGLPCYHASELLLNKANARHLDFWRDVARTPPGTQHDWEQVFAKYTAAVDNPACCVWRELLVAYPDAKVLLTVHPNGAEAWYDSVMKTIYLHSHSMWQARVLQVLTPRAASSARWRANWCGAAFLKGSCRTRPRPSPATTPISRR